VDLPGAIEFECPKCGSHPGERCRTYKGAHKEPCHERLEAAGFAKPRKPPRRKKKEKAGSAFVQQVFWEEEA
jgi:predicted RNA-binding Zn-ribbon protein involved in translation (DUF1610 family)